LRKIRKSIRLQSTKGPFSSAKNPRNEQIERISEEKELNPEERPTATSLTKDLFKASTFKIMGLLLRIRIVNSKAMILRTGNSKGEYLNLCQSKKL